MPQKKKKEIYLSIIIPTYNEEKNITRTLNEVHNFLKDYDYNYEVLIVDDGSTDSTRKLVSKFSKENLGFRLIKNPHKGKGPTIWTGVMKAEGKYIYIADADMSTPINELKRLFVWVVNEGFDIAIASREGLGASRVGEPYYRHLMGRFFNFLVQIIALPGINDSQCGFKLFKGTVAKDIFSKLKIYGKEAKEIKKAYMGAFDVEVLYLARKLGYKIKEVPVPWTYVKTNRLNPLRDSIKMTLDVIKVKINDIKGVYNF